MGELKRCRQLHLVYTVTGLLFALVLVPSASMAQVEDVIIPSLETAIAGETTERPRYVANPSAPNLTFQIPSTVIAANATVSDRAKDQTDTAAPPSMLAPTEEWVNPDSGQATETPDRRNVFLDNLSVYEPIYFLFGAAPFDGKFQLSFKYRFLNSDGTLVRRWSWLSGMHLGFTQTSFWDLDSESTPFADTLFKPELFYQWEDIGATPLWPQARFDLKFGFQHESNGQDGDDSRSLNIAYLRPKVVFHVFDAFELSLAAQTWFYVGSLSDNSTIRDFRGWSSLSASLGARDGLLLSTQVRGNPSTGKGSVQIDFSYPLNQLFLRNLALYFYVQFFTGYGESLLHFDQQDTRFRIGFGIVR
jgi:outer membrane phospholipase A